MANSPDCSEPSDGTVRSGSATAFSDDEDENLSKIEGIFYAKPLNRSTDPVYNILDKIDAELNSLSRSQSSTGTGNTVKRKSSCHQHDAEMYAVSSSEKQGSLKDDLAKDNPETKSTHRRRPFSRTTETYKHISGSAEIYSDYGNKSDNLSKDRSKSKPVLMFPTHIPLSFLKQDTTTTNGRSTQKEPVSHDKKPERKRLEGTDSVIEEKNKIARVSKKVQKEMNLERLATSKSAKSRREDESQTTMVVYPSTSQHFGIEDPLVLYKPVISKAEDSQNSDNIEQQLEETRSQLKDTRSQVMLSRFKHDSTLKDLQRLTERVDESKKQMKLYDEQICAKLNEIHKIDSHGLNKEEVLSYLKENEGLKSKMHNIDVIKLERDELVRQLELAKGDLFSEQKHSQLHIEELKEELENITHLLEEHQAGEDDLSQNILKMEGNMHEVKKSQDKLLEEKTKDCEEMKSKLQQVRTDSKKCSMTVDELKIKLADLKNNMSYLQNDLLNKKEENAELRNMLMTLQKKMLQQRTVSESIIEEHKRVLQSLRKGTDNAMIKLRESLFLEKQQEVESLRKKMEQDRQKLSSRCGDHITQQTVEFEEQLKAKNEEMKRLQHLIKQLDEDKAKMVKELEQEGEEQMKKALQLERQTLEAKYKWMIKQESDKTDKVRNQLKEITSSLEQEKQFKDTLLEQLQQTKVKLEETNLQNKHISHEKMFVVARAKDHSRQEMQSDADQFKERMKQEHHREVENLRKTAKTQETELQELIAEKQQKVRQERESSAVLNRTERTVINEINEDCLHTARLLGVTSRRVQIPSFLTNPAGMATNTTFSKTRPMTTAALANLRACNEELRSHIHELKQELEVQRLSMTKISQEKEGAIQQLKKKMEREKLAAMEKLKTDIVKNMTAQTTNFGQSLYVPTVDRNKLNGTFEVSMNHTKYLQHEEMQCLEHEIKKIALNQKELLIKKPAEHDMTTIKMNKLHDKVRQLQTENSPQKYTHLSPSITDLSNPVFFKKKFLPVFPTKDQKQMVNMLQERLKVAERDSESAAEQQKRNRNTMSKKMAEITRLQTTLTTQTQDLLQLEQAYSHLNSHYSQSHAMSAW